MPRVMDWVLLPEWEELVSVKKLYRSNEAEGNKSERGRRPRHLESLFEMKYKTVPGILRRPLRPNHSIIQ